jgi:dipeptidyl aminopeptidase/acylaminoacyl peptidase
VSDATPHLSSGSGSNETVQPYGRWPSPLRAEDAAAGKLSLSDLCSDGSALYWLESRPSEGGRVAFVRVTPGDEPAEVSPPGVSIRSRVHEYGGGAVCLVPSGEVGAFAYVELSDQRVWFVSGIGAEPVALSDVPPSEQRWAHGGLAASADGKWVLAVREVHTEHGTPPRRSVVAMSTRPDGPAAVESVLMSGHDFYGSPSIHPDGTSVAAATWDHPDMQWDFSRIEVVRLERVEDRVTGREMLRPLEEAWLPEGGGPLTTSVGQPMWGKDGRLVFVSDAQGWWQPYEHDGRRESTPRRLSAMAAEFHGADFVLSLRTMAELADGRVVAVVASEGRDALMVLDNGSDAVPSEVRLNQPCVDISAVCALGSGVAFIGSTPELPATVWWLPSSGDVARPVRPPATPVLQSEDVSVAEPFTLVGRSGRAVYGMFYPPRLAGAAGPADARPPLVVHCHSGPTSSARAGFDLTVQYFTSRGFAYAAVNYAGSTGYGRAFRCSLWGGWGEMDSEDCEDAARHLAAEGRVSPERLAVRGGSSGGLTALNALAAGDGFSAAVTLYGVTDLLGLAATTHDFEAHYMDRLIGPLPEAAGTYERRSPVNRAADLHGSVLLLQGLDDPIVPPAQAEGLVAALRAAGRRCEVRFFEGEGHGFRRQETLVACLETELDFYQEELGLSLGCPPG